MQNSDESESVEERLYDRRLTRALAFLALAATGYIAGIQLAIIAAQHPRLYLSYVVSVIVIGVDLVATLLAATLAESEFYLLTAAENEKPGLLPDTRPPRLRTPLGVWLGLWIQGGLRHSTHRKTARKILFDIGTYVPVGSLWLFSIWALFDAGLGSAILRFLHGA
jgi:hypothetical protein